MNTTKCSSIEEFAYHTSELFQQNPQKTRFVFKYRHKKGDFSLKTTDDEKVVKYKTSNASDLQKMEKVNNIVLAAMVAPSS